MKSETNGAMFVPLWAMKEHSTEHMDHQRHVSSIFLSVWGLSHILDSTCMINTGYTPSVVAASDGILYSKGQGCYPERSRKAGRVGYQEPCEIHQGQK